MSPRAHTLALARQRLGTAGDIAGAVEADAALIREVRGDAVAYVDAIEHARTCADDDARTACAVEGGWAGVGGGR